MTEADPAGTLERLGTFPPVTATDWRNMFPGQPTPVNPEAAQMVYDIAWFLVKDVTAAAYITVVTFKVALSRLDDLPEPSAYTAWLAVITTNEAHRYLEESPTRRLTSALMPTGSEREALFLADTLAEMRADHKLAILLRYRYNVPPAVITLALDMRPRKLARLFVAARESFAKNSSLPPAMLAVATPPRTRQLPSNVEAYGKRDLRPSVLGYPWLPSGFPGLPEREERRAKWLTAVATVVLLVALGIIITRPWGAARPTLNEAPVADDNTPGEILDDDG